MQSFILYLVRVMRSSYIFYLVGCIKRDKEDLNLTQFRIVVHWAHLSFVKPSYHSLFFFLFLFSFSMFLSFSSPKHHSPAWLHLIQPLTFAFPKCDAIAHPHPGLPFHKFPAAHEARPQVASGHTRSPTSSDSGRPKPTFVCGRLILSPSFSSTYGRSTSPMIFFLCRWPPNLTFFSLLRWPLNLASFFLRGSSPISPPSHVRNNGVQRRQIGTSPSVQFGETRSSHILEKYSFRGWPYLI